MSIEAYRHCRIFPFMECALALLLSGCAAPTTALPTTIDCEQPRTFYVVNHGWHTGIVVDRRDLATRMPELGDEFGAGPFLEVGWGDERFYRSPTFKTTLALRAALWPTASVLHIVQVTKPPSQYFSASRVVEISVPQSGYERLLDFVTASFSRLPEAPEVKLGAGIYGQSAFYSANGTFHAFNTCNTWVARAVRSTGYPISTAVISASGVMSQLDSTAHQKTPCTAVR